MLFFSTCYETGAVFFVLIVNILKKFVIHVDKQCLLCYIQYVNKNKHIVLHQNYMYYKRRI